MKAVCRIRVRTRREASSWLAPSHSLPIPGVSTFAFFWLFGVSMATICLTTPRSSPSAVLLLSSFVGMIVGVLSCIFWRNSFSDPLPLGRPTQMGRREQWGPENPGMCFFSPVLWSTRLFSLTTARNLDQLCAFPSERAGSKQWFRKTGSPVVVSSRMVVRWLCPVRV